MSKLRNYTRKQTREALKFMSKAARKAPYQKQIFNSKPLNFNVKREGLPADLEEKFKRNAEKAAEEAKSKAAEKRARKPNMIYTPLVKKG